MNVLGRDTPARRRARTTLTHRAVVWSSILTFRTVAVNSVLIRRKVRSMEEIPVWSHSGGGPLRDFLWVRRRCTRPYLVWAGSVTAAAHSPTLTPVRGSLEGERIPYILQPQV